MKPNNPFGLTQAALAVAFCMLQLHGALGCGFIGRAHCHCERDAAVAMTSATSSEDGLCPCDHSEPNEEGARDVCAASVCAPVRTSPEFSFAFVEAFAESAAVATPSLSAESPFFLDDASLAPGAASIPLYLRDRSFLI